MLLQLAATKCHVSEACRRAGVKRSDHRRWLEDDPDYAEAVDDEYEAIFDTVESTFVRSALVEKDRVAMRWYLQQRGGHRGYSNDSEGRGMRGVPKPHEGEVPTEGVLAAMADLISRVPELQLEATE